MPRVDATRIAWFLGLQRILRFPRFSVAPTRVSRYLRRPSDQTSDAGTSGEAMFRHGVAAPGKVNYPVRGAVPRSKGVVASIGASRAVTAFPRLMAKVGTERSPSTTAIKAPLTPTSASVRLGRFDGHIAAKSPAEARISDWSDKSPPLMNFLRASSGGGRSTALAPSLHSLPAQFLPAEKDNPVKRFPMLGTARSLPREDLMYTGDEFHSSNRVAEGQGRISQGRDATAVSDGQRGKAAVSTLHIDGSALGRWTIQHLERALNKPTTGMTGIDPRVAAPRSRVAPF